MSGAPTVEALEAELAATRAELAATRAELEAARTATRSGVDVGTVGYEYSAEGRTRVGLTETGAVVRTPEPGACRLDGRPGLSARDLYELGFSTLRALRVLSPTEAEAEALDRLEAFEGSASDLRVAAAVYERAGRVDEARALLGLLDPLSSIPPRKL